MNQVLKCKIRKHKIHRRKQAQTAFDLHCSIIFIFLDLSPMERETEPKINKRELIKLKTLNSKGNQQNEKTVYEWEKIFSNDITNME